MESYLMTQEQLNGLWNALKSTTSIQPTLTSGIEHPDGRQFLTHDGRVWERKDDNSPWEEVPPLQGNL